MRAYTTMLLAATLAGAFARETSAQVTKPRNPPAVGGRLPAPAKVSASQQPDGKIRVVWSSVDNATRYALVRSVPPTAAAAVTLPNPSDTVYIDSDVKPGSTYYYVVSADNEDRVGGMKKGSSTPVQAVQVPGLRPPTDTQTAADSSGGGAVPAPANVIVKPYPYTQATVSWASSREGTYYLVERLEQAAPKKGWEAIPGPIWRHHEGSFWRCCVATDDKLPQGDNVWLVYRVTALDTLPPHHRSRTVESKSTLFQKVVVEPPVVDAHQVTAGTSKWLKDGRFNAANLEGVQWMSTDPGIASVDERGSVTAKYAPYSTYIVATGKTRNGRVQSFIWRIEVLKP